MFDWVYSKKFKYLFDIPNRHLRAFASRNAITSHFTIPKNYFINYTISFYNTPNIPKFYFFPILFKYSILFHFLLFLFFYSFSPLSPSTFSIGLNTQSHTHTHTQTHDTLIHLSKLITTHTHKHKPSTKPHTHKPSNQFV